MITGIDWYQRCVIIDTTERRVYERRVQAANAGRFAPKGKGSCIKIGNVVERIRKFSSPRENFGRGRIGKADFGTRKTKRNEVQEMKTDTNYRSGKLQLMP